MSHFSQSSDMVSPLQKHPISLMNDVQAVSGYLETLGTPHPYINQNDLGFFKVFDAKISPWTHLNLPISNNAMVMATRKNVHLFTFTESSTNDEFRIPPVTHTLLITLPIAILRGRVPFMSEANVSNYLEFWKGLFVPVMDVELHYLVACGTNLPRKSSLMYINRDSIQSYVDGEG